MYKRQEYDISILPWTRTYRLALTEPNQLVISIARTPRREDQFIWFESIIDLKFYLYGLKERQQELQSNVTDFKASSVGVIRNDFNHEEIIAAGFSNIVAAETAEVLAQLLLKRRVDYIVTSDSAIKYFNVGFYLSEDNLYRAEPLPFMDFGIYYAFSKQTDPRIVEALNRASKELNAREDYVRPQLRTSQQ